MNACTIIASNYLPHARVLGESLVAHHPGATFSVLIIDDPGEGAHASERFTVLSPYDLRLDRAELHRMAFIYDVKEFATALKPWLLDHLLRGSDHALYFDPDIEVFAPLDDLSELARTHGIVLTPHVTQPLPRDNFLPSEEMLMQAGIYNLGFIGVGQKGVPFLRWWQERLKRHCIVDVERGIFVDQRWVDFVPALFEHTIVGDTTCNVAYWNLSHRRLVWDGKGYAVDGRPLRFFHYSGFSPDTMELSTHMGDVPRVVLSDYPEVRRLCEAYAARLYAHGLGRTEQLEYRFDSLANGLAVDATIRRDVLEALLEAERTGEPACPDPFDARGFGAFVNWLAAPVEPGGIPRHLRALYRRRGYLRSRFPEVEDGEGRRLVEWAYHTRRERPGIATLALARALTVGRYGPEPEMKPAAIERALFLLADRQPRLAGVASAYAHARRRLTQPGKRTTARSIVTVPSTPPLPGINVAGYFRAELGVGEAARRLIAGLEAGGIPHSTITYERTWNRQNHPFAPAANAAHYDTNVVCVNADQIANFRSDAPDLFTQRYTVGLWFWEVSRFPRELHGAFDLVDEVWVASDYARDAIASATSRPVRVVPLPVEAAPSPRLTRADVGFPDGFVFFFSFDCFSVPERKNPLGLVDAFSLAFSPGEGPTLVVKSINGDRVPATLRALEERAAGRPDIRVVDGYVSPAERDGMMALCDCYVSLHRSEGYGLTMAEAMAAAKPVIATGYSGNLTFMDEKNSLLVPYRTTQIPSGCDPYPKGAEWAEPDLDAAAALMRHVYEHQDDGRKLGRRARADILGRNTPSRTGAFVASRLVEIRAERNAHALDAKRAVVPASALLRPGGRRPTQVARRILHRLLWPYFEQQRTFDTAVAEAIRAHESFGATRFEAVPPASEPAEVSERSSSAQLVGQLPAKHARAR